ncbi:MAG: hypothetical protein ACJ8LM_17735 [Candidatus Udaeobacter sp.]
MASQGVPERQKPPPLYTRLGVRMESLTALGIVALIPLLIMFGEFLKHQGVSPQRASFANMLISVILTVGYSFVQRYPDKLSGIEFANAIMLGIGIGLAASGFYALTRSMGARWFGGTDAYYEKLAKEMIYEPRYRDMGEGPNGRRKDDRSATSEVAVYVNESR